MSYSNISEVLLEYNKETGINQKSALILSNTSELEIKSLLKQVDTMIHQKKLRWERQKQELDAKLQSREQDYRSQKAELEQKSSEIVQLKGLLDSMESTTQQIMKKYENEIDTLNKQLSKLKSDYIKLQKKYKKNAKKGSGGSDVTIKHPLDLQCESSSIIKLSKTDQTSGSSGFINATACLSSTAFPKTNHLKEPVTTKSRNLTEHDKFYYESEIERLNRHLVEHMTKEMELLKENEQMNKTILQYKKLNGELLKKFPGDKENRLTASSSQERGQTSKSIEFYQKEMRKRDEHIRNLEDLDRAENIELQFYKDEVKKYKKQELLFKQQIDQMKRDHEEAFKRLESMDQENRKLKDTVQKNEERLQSDENIKKLADKERERCESEIFKLNEELNRNLVQLNEKIQQVSKMTERCQNLERKVKEKDEEIGKINQELIMTVAHVEALRLENHFMRQSLVEKKSDEKEVVEMQKKYHQVLDLTEKENKRLKNEICALTSNVESLKAKLSSPSNLAMQNPDTKKHPSSGSAAQDFEARSFALLREEYEKQLNSLKKQHELSVKRLNNEIEKLCSEKNALVAEFENEHRQRYHVTSDRPLVINNNKINRSNMSSIQDSLSVGVLSVSNLTKNPHQHYNSHKASTDEKKRRSFGEEVCMGRDTAQRSIPRFNPGDFEPIEDSPLKSSRLSNGSLFRSDENSRKKVLETMLDVHIENLRRSSGHEHAKSNNLNQFI